jgi:heat shock protein HslJ
MRKIIFSLAVAASALTAAACSAQAAPAAPAIQTRAEAIAQADARFAQMDTNHDGLISTTEMQDYRAAIHDRMIARGGDAPTPSGGPRHGGMDRHMRSDGNAKIGSSMTKAEFEARAGQRFDRIDANHDGVIDATERANRAEMRHVDRRERHDGTAPAPLSNPAH